MKPYFKLILCVLFSLCVPDSVVAFITSPRVLLVCFFLLWLHCERHMEDMRVCVVEQSTKKIVQENHDMSRAIMNLSDQHQILCEIRNNVLRALRYSKDTLFEVSGLHSPVNSSGSGGVDQYAKRKERFKERNMSESFITLH